MKRKGIILGFIVLFVAAALLYSKIALTENIRANKANESINFYTNPGGTGLVKKGEITPAGKLRVDTIEDLAGSGTPPGMVPVGGMVAVMPSTDPAVWQPPATGVIKDGFMRADGHTITAQNVTDGSKIPAGIGLPNMVDKFTRGDTTSGAPGGNDSVTPSGTVSQPTFNGVAVARSTWFKSQGISATNPGHYHSMSGAGTTLDIPPYDYGTGDFSVSGSTDIDHDHSISGGVTGYDAGTGTYDVNTYDFGDGTFSVNTYDFGTGSFSVPTVNPSHYHNGIADAAYGGGSYNGICGIGGSDTVTSGFYRAGSSMPNCARWYTQAATTAVTASILKSNFDHPHTINRSNFDHPHTINKSLFDHGHAHDLDVPNYDVDNRSLVGGAVAKSNFDHDHSITGSIGKVTSGCDGNTDKSCVVTFNENNDNMSEWSAAGDYTPSGSVSQPSFTGNSQDNKPAYTTVVWVIRVM